MFKARAFYGWRVVAACFVVNATMSLTFGSFGVFFKPLAAEFGWSRSLTSSAFTLFLIGYAVSAIVSGRLADRYQPRLILLASAALGATGLCLSGTIGSIDQLRLLSMIAGLGAGATQSIPASAVQRSFRGQASAGTALALVVSGAGVGQIIFPVLTTRLIISFGWRDTYLIIGLIFLFVVSCCSFFIQKDSEKEAGLPGTHGPKTADNPGLSAAKVLPTLAFVGIFSGFCIGAIVTQILQSQLIPHATDIGLSSTAAATVLGLTGGISIVGRLGLSGMSSKLRWQTMLYVSFFGMAAGLLWLSFLEMTWMLYGFALVFGIFNGVRVVALYSVLTEFFGFRSSGELIGICSGGAMLVAAAAPYLAGFIYDSTGNYFIAFAILAGMALSGGIFIMGIKKPVNAQETTKPAA